MATKAASKQKVKSGALKHNRTDEKWAGTNGGLPTRSIDISDRALLGIVFSVIMGFMAVIPACLRFARHRWRGFCRNH